MAEAQVTRWGSVSKGPEGLAGPGLSGLLLVMHAVVVSISVRHGAAFTFWKLGSSVCGLVLGTGGKE